MLSMLALSARADLLSCDQQQSLCKAECTVENIGDDSAIRSCEASCLGEYTACTFESGKKSASDMAEEAIKTGKSVAEEAQAFIEGFNKK